MKQQRMQSPLQTKEVIKWLKSSKQIASLEEKVKREISAYEKLPKTCAST